MTEAYAIFEGLLKSFRADMGLALEKLGQMRGLETPEIADAIGQADVARIKREIDAMERAVRRALDDEADAHERLTAIALSNPVITPYFGK